jgi:hypothetical protein
LARNPPPPDLEAALIDGLVLSHRSATVARVMPLVLWRQRDRFDLDRLVAHASRRDQRAVGFFLELAGLLGDDPPLVRAARRLRDKRRTRIRQFFAGAHGPFALELAHRKTPKEARRWGYLMNMPFDSFRTLFEKHARLS